MAVKIALAGNPNSGKTTLFNALTGANQYVGNWPGVTVEKKEGKLKGNKEVVVQDLPGAHVPDGMVASPVAELQLICVRPEGTREQLVPQADPKHGKLSAQKTKRLDHLRHIRGITGPVGDQNAVRGK